MTEIRMPSGLTPVEVPRPDDPCKELWAAVLSQAVKDLTAGGAFCTRWWFLGQNTGFEDVCDALEIDPGFFRRRLGLHG